MKGDHSLSQAEIDARLSAYRRRQCASDEANEALRDTVQRGVRDGPRRHDSVAEALQAVAAEFAPRFEKADEAMARLRRLEGQMGEIRTTIRRLQGKLQGVAGQ